MSDKLHYTTDDGIDFIEGKFETTPLTYDITPDTDASILGRTITPRAASHMISEMIQDRVKNVIKDPMIKGQDKAFIANFVEQKLKTDRLAIEFGKENLQAILRQKDCIGIRFTFCTNSQGVTSLIAMGIEADKDQDGNIIKNDKNNIQPVPLKRDKYNITQDQMAIPTLLTSEDDPIIKEEGNGTGVTSTLELLGQTIAAMLPDPLPNVIDKPAMEELSKQVAQKTVQAYFGKK